MNKLLIALLLAFSFPATAQVDSFQIEVNRLLELTSSKEQFVQAIEQMVVMQRDNFEGLVEDAFWDQFIAEVKKSGYEDIMKELLPLYGKYYTVEEVRAVNAFYSSPAGKSFLEKSPQLQQEMMAIGMEWGQRMGEQIAIRLEAEEGK